MTWNYRVIHREDWGYGLYEVYYDDDGTIKFWTESSVDGNHYDTITELRTGLERMLEALDKDVLPYGTEDS